MRFVRIHKAISSANLSLTDFVIFELKRRRHEHSAVIYFRSHTQHMFSVFYFSGGGKRDFCQRKEKKKKNEQKPTGNEPEAIRIQNCAARVCPFAQSIFVCQLRSSEEAGNRPAPRQVFTFQRTCTCTPHLVLLKCEWPSLHEKTGRDAIARPQKNEKSNLN